MAEGGGKKPHHSHPSRWPLSTFAQARDRRPWTGEDADMLQLAITVPGLPPAKNEAKSMLAPGHVHSSRVMALLLAVRETVEDEPLFFGEQSLGLELVL